MNEIQSTLLALLPQGRKITTGGWESFNAVCCHHRGEKADRRRRGGIKIDGEAWTYHCFNCSYKAGWSPGKLLSGNTKMLFKWLGLGDNDIGKLGIVALKYQESMPQESKALNFTLKEIPLPDNSLSIVDWLNTGSDDPDLIAVVEYLLSRGMEWEWYNWHWSTAPGYRDRLLIPFYQDGKIVGYTGRKVTEGKPKYLTDSQSGYVFNLDRQTRDRAYVIVVEGQFDAIAVDGVDRKSTRLNSSHSQQSRMPSSA